MSAPAHVRPARPGDGAVIGRIQAQAWRETYPGLLPAAQIAAVDPVERGAMWTDAITRGIARGICVAEREGVAIGFGACTAQRAADLAQAGYGGEVTALYVLRAGQRCGAGRALMAALARRLIAEGDRGMALWVLSSNAPARRFYEAIGGLVLAERSGDGARHAETAYGWRDLRGLVQAAGADQEGRLT